MACNHFRIPVGAQVSSIKVVRCQEGQLHRIQYYRCLTYQRETFMYPAQAQRLALCNLSSGEKDRIGKKTLKQIHERLANGVPVTANYFLSEYPPGMDYAYAHEKSAIYQQIREGGIIMVEDSEEEE